MHKVVQMERLKTAAISWAGNIMRKNGFTLIELMIGMVIAMLSMSMMMMMFKQVSQVSFGSAADAQYDTDIQIGLMVAQKYLQNAGYGSGQANDIALGSYAGTGNDAVYWRYVPDLDQPAQYKCQGISEKIDQEGNRSVHRLLLLTNAACNGAGLVSAGAWSIEQTVIAIKKSNSDKIFSYEMADGSCTPYGIDENTVIRQQITITAKRQHITADADEASKSIQHTLCLNNVTAI